MVHFSQRSPGCQLRRRRDWRGINWFADLPMSWAQRLFDSCCVEQRDVGLGQSAASTALLCSTRLIRIWSISGQASTVSFMHCLDLPGACADCDHSILRDSGRKSLGDVDFSMQKACYYAKADAGISRRCKRSLIATKHGFDARWL